MYRLLIVDDEPMICEGLKAYLTQWKTAQFEWIHTAPGAQEAVEEIEKEHPDIMILNMYAIWRDWESKIIY